MTSLLLLRFGRYLVIPALILIYTLGVGFAGYRWGKAGAELAHVEAQLDISQKIQRAALSMALRNASTACVTAVSSPDCATSTEVVPSSVRTMVERISVRITSLSSLVHKD